MYYINRRYTNKLAMATPAHRFPLSVFQHRALAQNYQCFLCHQVPSPDSTIDHGTCGAVLCAFCCPQRKSPAEQFSCPKCAQPMARTFTKQGNHAVYQLHQLLAVGCQFCAWTGTFSALQSHVAVCEGFDKGAHTQVDSEGKDKDIAIVKETAKEPVATKETAKEKEGTRIVFGGALRPAEDKENAAAQANVSVSVARIEESTAKKPLSAAEDDKSKASNYKEEKMESPKRLNFNDTASNASPEFASPSPGSALKRRQTSSQKKGKRQAAEKKPRKEKKTETKWRGPISPEDEQEWDHVISEIKEKRKTKRGRLCKADQELLDLDELLDAKGVGEGIFTTPKLKKLGE